MFAPTRLACVWGSIVLALLPTAYADPSLNDAAARSAGYADATPDGEREGRERGHQRGTREGYDDGYREGFSRCEREEREAAYRQGYQDGEHHGQNEGEHRGSTEGRSNGDASGRRDGYADGVKRADNDANRDATPPGRNEGIAQAERSDAKSRGRAEGLVAGDRDALERAQSFDYERGRKDYRAERYREDSVQDEFAQKAGPLPLNTPLDLVSNLRLLNHTGLESVRPVPHESPDFRYRQLRRSYPTPNETAAYAQGYDQGYREAFQMAFQNNYLNAYYANNPRGESDGCRIARNRDYSADRNRGYREGYDVAYRRAYDSAYNREFRIAYDAIFLVASREAYNSTYQSAYNKHYEAARTAAYQQRYREIYSAAFNAAHDEKYAQVYPGYAAKYFQIGRADEAKDFKDRPLRLTHIYVTETSPNGVFEPGENLRIKFIVRNFDPAVINAQSVKLQLSTSSQGIVLTKPVELLSKSLKARSVTIVREALGFEVKEGARGALGVKLVVLKDGKEMDSLAVDFSSANLVSLTAGALPQLKEGVPAKLPVIVENSGNQPTPEDLSVTLSSDTFFLDIQNPTVLVGALAAGEKRTIEFEVLPKRLNDSQVTIPLKIEAKAAGKRVGFATANAVATVSGSYKIELASSILKLHEPGTYQMKYQVTNTMDRASSSKLSVTARVLGQEASKFQITSMMPLVIDVLKPGSKSMVTFPLRVLEKNGGGQIEIIVMESNRIVSRSVTNF